MKVCVFNVCSVLLLSCAVSDTKSSHAPKSLQIPSVPGSITMVTATSSSSSHVSHEQDDTSVLAQRVASTLRRLRSYRNSLQEGGKSVPSELQSIIDKLAAKSYMSKSPACKRGGSISEELVQAGLVSKSRYNKSVEFEHAAVQAIQSKNQVSIDEQDETYNKELAAARSLLDELKAKNLHHSLEKKEIEKEDNA